MIKLKPALLLLMVFLSMYSNAVVAPVATAPATFDPFKIRPSELEKITGRKLTLFQKIKLTLAQMALRKYSSEGMTGKQRKQARLSMILGILGFTLLLIALAPALGFLSLFSIPAAILAIVFGSKSLRGNSNTEGIIGVVAGGLTIVFITLAVILVALTVSA